MHREAAGGQTVPQNNDHEDHEKHFPLIGGITISTFKKNTGGTYGLGTLGFFASINNESGYKNVVLVSNFHVLGENGESPGDKVYQPSWTLQPSGDWLEDFESHLIGRLRDLPPLQNHPYRYPEDGPTGQTLPYHVDCATARLDICVSPISHTNCGVRFSDVLRELNLNGSPKITGVGRITAADEGKRVYVVGARSGVTEGLIKKALTDIGDRKNVIEISVIDFPEEGDSGSTVVDAQGRLVGLFHRYDALREVGHASHIAPVLDLLKVTPITAANEPHSNPAFSSSAASMTFASASAGPTAMLRKRLEETEEGRRIIGALEDHHAEVVDLVNRHRRVTLAWHRNKGPMFLNSALMSVHHLEYVIPREIEGVTRETLIRNMAKALGKHGSAGLRSLAGYVDKLVEYVNAADSADEMVGLVGKGHPA
jgi:hypothetical protein